MLASIERAVSQAEAERGGRRLSLDPPLIPRAGRRVDVTDRQIQGLPGCSLAELNFDVAAETPENRNIAWVHYQVDKLQAVERFVHTFEIGATAACGLVIRPAGLWQYCASVNDARLWPQRLETAKVPDRAARLAANRTWNSISGSITSRARIAARSRLGAGRR